MSCMKWVFIPEHTKKYSVKSSYIAAWKGCWLQNYALDQGCQFSTRRSPAPQLLFPAITPTKGRSKIMGGGVKQSQLQCDDTSGQNLEVKSVLPRNYQKPMVCPWKSCHTISDSPPPHPWPCHPEVTSQLPQTLLSQGITHRHQSPKLCQGTVGSPIY